MKDTNKLLLIKPDPHLQSHAARDTPLANYASALFQLHQHHQLVETAFIIIDAGEHHTWPDVGGRTPTNRDEYQTTFCADYSRRCMRRLIAGETSALFDLHLFPRSNMQQRKTSAKVVVTLIDKFAVIYFDRPLTTFVTNSYQHYRDISKTRYFWTILI